MLGIEPKDLPPTPPPKAPTRPMGVLLEGAAQVAIRCRERFESKPLRPLAPSYMYVEHADLAAQLDEVIGRLNALSHALDRHEGNLDAGIG